jgi:hypothetical protein
LGKALSTEVTIVHPIPGKHIYLYWHPRITIFFSKTIDVQIDKLDTPLDQDWYDLVSTNTTAGKTWVFDGTGGMINYGGLCLQTILMAQWELGGMQEVLAVLRQMSKNEI